MMAVADIKYGPWTISFDPPPIPVRTMDWHFAHEDFDASYEGEEDGYVSNGLCGSAESVEACKREIADIEEDREMPSTAAALAKIKLDATIFGVATFAHCTAATHDGTTRGCSCQEIAERVIARMAEAA